MITFFPYTENGIQVSVADKSILEPRTSSSTGVTLPSTASSASTTASTSGISSISCSSCSSCSSSSYDTNRMKSSLSLPLFSNLTSSFTKPPSNRLGAFVSPTSPTAGILAFSHLASPDSLISPSLLLDSQNAFQQIINSSAVDMKGYQHHGVHHHHANCRHLLHTSHHQSRHHHHNNHHHHPKHHQHGHHSNNHANHGINCDCSGNRISASTGNYNEPINGSWDGFPCEPRDRTTNCTSGRDFDQKDDTKVTCSNESGTGKMETSNGTSSLPSTNSNSEETVDAIDSCCPCCCPGCLEEVTGTHFDEGLRKDGGGGGGDEEEEDFSDLAEHEIIEMVGDDSFGRKVITIYACRLPPSDNLDHNRLLRYILHTLDQFVENDYVLVYFHHGLNSGNKPPIKWLWTAFKAFDRRYKKNLKNLYLVHPTNFIRILWQLFKPAIR